MLRRGWTGKTGRASHPWVLRAVRRMTRNHPDCAGAGRRGGRGPRTLVQDSVSGGELYPIRGGESSGKIYRIGAPGVGPPAAGRQAPHCPGPTVADTGGGGGEKTLGN